MFESSSDEDFIGKTLQSASNIKKHTNSTFKVLGGHKLNKSYLHVEQTVDIKYIFLLIIYKQNIKYPISIPKSYGIHKWNQSYKYVDQT